MIETAALPHRHIFRLFVLMVFCYALTSCSTVKNYPQNQPFVYNSNVTLNGKFSTDERKDLLSKLREQLHDSIDVRRVQKLVFWNTLSNPPVYDSMNAEKSVIFMRALLNSLGYYRDTITYDTTLQVVGTNGGTQYRTTVNFDVFPGKLIRMDSIRYNLENDTLQKITADAMAGSLLKKGAPFAKALISTEFDRLTDVYRNNGYLRFSRDELLAVWDTVGIELLRPTLDPIAQAQQLEALRRRRENPTADIEVRLRANEDTSHLIRYYVGDVTIYPDLNADTASFVPTETTINGLRVISYQDLYRPKVLAENVFFQKGRLYSQRTYLRTLNRFNSIGTWRLVSIDQIPRGITDTVDFVIRLTPATKYSFNANIEGSQNFGNQNAANNLFTNGNLVGFNIGLQNRNFARGANLASTSFRFATEVLSDQAVQTKQVSFNHSIFFPRLLPAFGFVPDNFKDNIKTSFGFGASYSSRRNFFDLTSVTSSWGYEFNRRNVLLSLRIPNIEYTYLRRGPDLEKLIQENRSYEFIFNSGLVASVLGAINISGGQRNIANAARFNAEASGLLSGFLRSEFLDSNLQRFIKLDGEFRQTHTIRRTAFAWRAFAGAGYQLASERFKYNRYLPFYKSYVAGGANSMRAWPLRRLGPGSTIRSFERTVAPDRFGEMQLEANAEYRFYITTLAGFQINSAVFTDIGNVWYLRENPDFPNGNFKIGNLWRDIAIGAGTGLRVDFGIFLIRLDFAYKLKDPSPDIKNADKQNKFFPYRRFRDGQFQLGVTYPF